MRVRHAAALDVLLVAVLVIALYLKTELGGDQEDEQGAGGLQQEETVNMGPFMLFGRGQTEFASSSGFPGDGRAACSESPCSLLGVVTVPISRRYSYL